MSRYTFRTTRKTAWLDDVLSKIPSKDLSDFIRETLIVGLQRNVPQTSDIQQTIVRQTLDNSPTIVEPPRIEVSEISDDELDNKLMSR